MSLYKTGDPYTLIWQTDGANVPLNKRINVDSAMTDCDSPTSNIGLYNSSTLGTPYKSSQTASTAGLIFSLKRGSAPWNKQLAFTDGSGEFYLRSTTDTSAWTAWQRMVPRFALQSYSASVTTAANGGVNHAEFNIAVSGFVPVAVHTATTNHGNVLLQHVSINGTKANIYGKNTSASSITSTWTMCIFYVSSGFGV